MFADHQPAPHELLKGLNQMLAQTTASRSISVSQTQQPTRRAASDGMATGYYRGRDRVIDIAVGNADRDGVRRCQCPDCCQRRAQNTPVAVAR